MKRFKATLKLILIFFFFQQISGFDDPPEDFSNGYSGSKRSSVSSSGHRSNFGRGGFASGNQFKRSRQMVSSDQSNEKPSLKRGFTSVPKDESEYWDDLELEYANALEQEQLEQYEEDIEGDYVWDDTIKSYVPYTIFIRDHPEFTDDDFDFSKQQVILIMF